GPDDEDVEPPSPSGTPVAPAAPPAAPPPPGPSPADAAPVAPEPVRPGSGPAGSAGPSRYPQGLGRPAPSGRPATWRDHPQPAPAWARNRPPGGQDNGSEEPDPQDQP